MSVLGVDIGGTKIAAGEVGSGAEVRGSSELPTQAEQGFIVSLSQVYRSIEQNLHSRIHAIGICAPGPLNPKTGTVLNPPTLPGWRNIPITELIQARFQIPCRLENDANAAGLAEAMFGAGRGYSDQLYVTISTGIGTGIILDRKIYHGKAGAAGEGGHITIDYSSEVVCACGLRGCIEAFASARAIARRAEELRPEFPDSAIAAPATCRGVGEAVAAGDPLAVRVLEETSVKLSAWLGGLISLLDPDIVVIGGGGAAALGEPLLSRLRLLTPQRTINQNAVNTPIVPATLSANVGILGAAAVALQG
jgi:glucokinase